MKENPYAKYINPSAQGENPYAKYVASTAPQINKIESAARGALQGVTVGSGDEIYGGIRSLTRDISRGIEKELYGDNMLPPITYEEGRDSSQLANKQAAEANPKSYLGGEIVGSLAGGGLGASTKTGAAIANSLRSGNLAARIAKGSIAGAASGGLYGANTAEEGGRIEGAELGAKYGGAIGAALPIAGAAGAGALSGTRTAIKGAFAKSADEIDDISSNIRSITNKHYAAMREEGANIAENKTQEIFNTIDNNLSSRGILNPALHGKTMAVVNDLKNAAKNGTLDLETLDQQRRVLSRIKPGIDNAEDAGMASAAVRAIDSIQIEGKDLTKGTVNAVDSLFKGRAEARRAIKIDEIGDILRQADGDPNRIKAGLTRFVNKKDNLRGFTTEEKDSLMNAARSTATERLLKMGGKFGIDLGTSLTPGNTFLPLVGGIGGSPAIPALGTAARQLQKYMARGKAEEVIRTIQAGGLPKEIMDLPATEASQIVQQIKLLPAPPPTQAVTMIDSAGVARPMTNVERQAAEIARSHALETGLTPDVRAAAQKYQRGREYDAAENVKNVTKDAQIQDMWENSGLSLKDMLTISQQNLKDLSEALGGTVSPSNLGEALKNAILKKGIK